MSLPKSDQLTGEVRLYVGFFELLLISRDPNDTFNSTMCLMRHLTQLQPPHADSPCRDYYTAKRRAHEHHIMEPMNLTYELYNLSTWQPQKLEMEARWLQVQLAATCWDTRTSYVFVGAHRSPWVLTLSKQKKDLKYVYSIIRQWRLLL